MKSMYQYRDYNKNKNILKTVDSQSCLVTLLRPHQASFDNKVFIKRKKKKILTLRLFSLYFLKFWLVFPSPQNCVS